MSETFRPVAPNTSAPNVNRKTGRDAGDVLDLLCGRWTSAILDTLANGTRRSNELARALPGSSRKTLTHSLRYLELRGLVERRVYAEVPARVEYSLTPLGHTFAELVRFLGVWAKAHPDELAAALGAKRGAT